MENIYCSKCGTECGSNYCRIKNTRMCYACGGKEMFGNIPAGGRFFIYLDSGECVECQISAIRYMRKK